MMEARNAALNSTASKLRNFYRDLQFRVKHPIAQTIKSLTPHLSYSYWIRHRERRSSNPARIAQAIAVLRYTPKISVVMPVYNTPVDLLDMAIRSVETQHYENWELCICDDASPNPNVRANLESWQKRDPRIKVTYSTRNEGISGASNRALDLASGEFVGLLDHDDELSPDALYEVVNLLQEQPDADMIYSDEDKLDPEGRRVCPQFKPDWSPEYMLAMMYTCHFGVYRTQLLKGIGGFRLEFTGSQDYDLVLRLSEKTDRIYHIPKVLYHWRMAPDSVAASGDAKPYAFEAAKRALTEHLSRRGIPGEMLHGEWRGYYRVRFNLEGTDKVSIVIPNLGRPGALRACIRTIKEKTSYPNYEVIVVDNRSLDEDTWNYLASRSCRIISVDESSSLSRLISLGAAHAQGAYLMLLHGDTEVISADWITAMLGFCRQREIGAVGAKLLYRSGRIQHIGVVLGLRGVAGYPLRGHHARPQGFPDPSQFIRNCSAVSGACMMVRKEVFEELGGFDEQLQGTYNDIDFCLRIREAGYRIVWTPEAELYKNEPLARSSLNRRQAKDFERRWGKVLKNDPYYSPNLTLRYEDLGYRV
jgi:O-antigen biosynthesis protein